MEEPQETADGLMDCRSIAATESPTEEDPALQCRDTALPAKLSHALGEKIADQTKPIGK